MICLNCGQPKRGYHDLVGYCLGLVQPGTYYSPDVEHLTDTEVPVSAEAGRDFWDFVVSLGMATPDLNEVLSERLRREVHAA